jgi:hypothetical protein
MASGVRRLFISPICPHRPRKLVPFFVEREGPNSRRISPRSAVYSWTMTTQSQLPPPIHLSRGVPTRTEQQSRRLSSPRIPVSTAFPPPPASRPHQTLYDPNYQSKQEGTPVTRPRAVSTGQASRASTSKKPKVSKMIVHDLIALIGEFVGTCVLAFVCRRNGLLKTSETDSCSSS